MSSDAYLIPGSGLVNHDLDLLIPGAGIVTSSAEAITGTGALTAPASTMTGSAQKGLVTAVAIVSVAVTLAAQGILGHTGSDAISGVAPTLAGEAELGHIDDGSLTAPVPRVIGSGSLSGTQLLAQVLLIPGVGIVNTQAPALIPGAGIVQIPGQVGDGAISGTVPTLSGTAVLAHVGTGNVQGTVPTVSGIAVLGHVCASLHCDSDLETCDSDPSAPTLLIPGAGVINTSAPALIPGTGVVSVSEQSGWTADGLYDSCAVTSTVPIINGAANVGPIGSGNLSAPVPTVAGQSSGFVPTSDQTVTLHALNTTTVRGPQTTKVNG